MTASCLPDVATAIDVYQQLRRPRVKKVAADAAKTNDRKAAGPLARTLFSLLMPIAMKTFFTPEKMFSSLHRYRIAWDDVVKS